MGQRGLPYLGDDAPRAPPPAAPRAVHPRRGLRPRSDRGAFGARSKLWKAAKENVERGWKYAYRDRKNKKRDFRKLWIIRINAGAHQHGMSYSVFMHGLKKAGIEIDRKVLSDIAVNDAEAFTALAEKARSALDAA